MTGLEHELLQTTRIDGMRMAAAKQRRTQEERSAITREKVIRATIDCIVEEGLVATTAARIAARSGVTWGAIVHQFGDKDSLLHAIVERNAETYMGLLTDALRRAGVTPRERVEALIDVTWQYINEPAAFAFNELIIHNRATHDERIQRQQEELSNAFVKSMWERFFGEFHIPAETLDTVRNVTLAALHGLSIMRLISPQSRPRYHKEIAVLKKFVQDIIDPPTAATNGEKQT